VPEAHARQDPASVPDVLLAWIQALSALDQAQRIQQAVLHLLNSRPGQTQAKPAQVSALASMLHLSERQGRGSEYLPDNSGASRKLHERPCLGISALCMMATVACSRRGCCNNVHQFKLQLCCTNLSSSSDGSLPCHSCLPSTYHWHIQQDRLPSLYSSLTNVMVAVAAG